MYIDSDIIIDGVVRELVGFETDKVIGDVEAGFFFGIGGDLFEEV